MAFNSGIDVPSLSSVGQVQSISPYVFAQNVSMNMANLAKKDQLERERSARNYIRAAAEAGKPWDSIANDVAQFDPQLAQNMENNYRTKYQFNYSMDKDIMNSKRRQLADKIFHDMLMVGLNNGETVEHLAENLYAAASYIAEFDSELAYKLLKEADTQMKARMSAEARVANRNPATAVKDDEKAITDTWKKSAIVTPDADTDPSSYQLRQRQGAAAKRLLQWKVSTGNPIYNRYLSILEGVNGIENCSDEQITSLINGLDVSGGNESTPSQAPVPASKTGSDKPKGNTGTPSFNAQSTEPVAVPVNITKRSASGAVVYDPKKGAQLSRFVRNAQSLDELAQAEEVLLASADMKGDKESALNQLNKDIDDQRKYIKDMEENFGKNTPAARVINATMTPRGKAVVARQLRQMGTVANGLYSTTPWSIMDNIIQIQSPDYALSDAMQKTATRIKTGQWDKDIMSILAESGDGFLSKIAGSATIYDALESGARDALNTIRPMYQQMLENCKTEQEKQDLKAALKETFSWPDNLFKALEDPRGSLGTSADIRRGSEALKKQKVNVYSPESVIGTDSTTVTPKKRDWKDFK